MSSDFYALFKQPRDEPSKAPRKRTASSTKDKPSAQLRMNASGGVERPGDARKKRKNSVIEIASDDEEDESVKKQPIPPKKPPQIPSKPLHPLFTSNYTQRGGSGGSAVATKQVKARMPAISESLVQPDDDRPEYYDIGELPFGRRDKPVHVADEAVASTSSFRLASLAFLSQSDAIAKTKTKTRGSAQSTAQVTNHSQISASSLLHTHTLRPTHPSDILHNATLATYLSAWMANLALGSPRWEDVRTLQQTRKTRKKGASDDWIVDDMFDFDLDFDEVVQPSHLPTLPKSDYSDCIESNCIALQGPPGSGKTAAVYASAQELGWDVFEVFPGLKRSGKEVLDLVGAVGENHIIERGEKALKELNSQPKKKHKQSVILLEEVDVLFEEDKGFWSAVQALVQYSKRPVVLTCNDASTIPANSITLQATLEFERPPHDAVRRFLTEKGLTGVDTVESPDTAHPHNLTCIDTPPDVIEEDRSWLVDASGGLYGKQFDEGCDLRQALMQVHVGGCKSDSEENGFRDTSVTASTSHTSSQSSLKQAALAADTRSFVDAHVAQPLWRAMEYLESETPNELLGHDTIGRIARPHQTTLAVFGCEESIAGYILQQAALDNSPTPFIPSLTSQRHAQQDILLDMRLDMLGAFAPIMPSPALSVDYAPYIRELVKCDDREEALVRAHSIASGRGTRNSMRGKYRRMYDYDCVASLRGSYFIGLEDTSAAVISNTENAAANGSGRGVIEEE